MCYKHGNYGSSELEQDLCIQQVTVGEQACEAGNHRAHVSGYCKHDEQAYPDEVGLVFQQSDSDEIWYCYYDRECEEQYQLGTDNVRHGQGQGIVALGYVDIGQPAVQQGTEKAYHAGIEQQGKAKVPEHYRFDEPCDGIQEHQRHDKGKNYWEYHVAAYQVDNVLCKHWSVS